MKIRKAEKWMLATTDIEKYNTYYCNEHGVYQKIKDVDDAKCIYCKKENKQLSNLEELILKYKKELGL